MTRAPDGVVAFDFDGSRYEMIFDMKAIAFFERETDVSMITALGEMERVRASGEAPKVSTLAFLMQAGLRRHHPEVTAERALRMAADPEVQAALGTGVRSAFPEPDDDEEGDGDDASAGGNARARAKPKKASPGTRSSKRRSKQG